ncbi:MAG: bis(5'-nucleosyl)-tetraphosphatase (symmetrical) YqeK [Streptococcaceae bacterium]|jgi:predicted HD superfamily hydrolase involved in NAD metabolism|nr:bis(5'-nucleosyl)-tetraphosphatase (symmetrical) YqeK [Streptococcaceae bacterium]
MLTRDEIIEKMQATLSKKRFTHCLGVEAAARALAERYDYADVEKAGLTGLLHDYAKERTAEDYAKVIDREGLNPDLKNWSNAVWHGYVGWIIVRDEVGVTDREMLHAIEVHTVGCAEMSLLDKIVYVADYIEENRDFPGVDDARKIASESLDAAVAYETVHTVAHLAEKHLPIYPQTIETYNAYIGMLKV